jgi:hypothetical protein
MSATPCDCTACVQRRKRQVSPATSRVIGTRKVRVLDERDPRVVARSRDLRKPD